MSEIIKLDSVEHKDMLDIPDEDMEAALSGYDVDKVKALLDSVIADKSMKKEKRREVVAKIVTHQPHSTKKFSSYDKWNSIIVAKVSDPQNEVPVPVALVLAIAPAAFSVPYGVSAYIMSPESLAIGENTWLAPLLAILIGIGLSTAFVILFVSWVKDCQERLAENHSVVYEGRSLMSLGEHRVYKEAIAKANQNAQIKREKQQLAELSAKFSGDNVEISLLDAKQDLSEAKARIASYETDMTKALSRPAFNDITVKEVSDMVKNMRTCHRQLYELESAAVPEDQLVRAFAASVDDLWVSVDKAEEVAKRIGWGEVSKSERNDLKLAQELIAHADDASYSDEVRAGFYEKLKTVVDRLNTKKTIVPTKIVGTLEEKSRRLLVETGKEPVDA